MGEKDSNKNDRQASEKAITLDSNQNNKRELSWVAIRVAVKTANKIVKDSLQDIRLIHKQDINELAHMIATNAALKQ